MKYEPVRGTSVGVITVEPSHKRVCCRCGISIFSKSSRKREIACLDCSPYVRRDRRRGVA